ncbi:uncharacterized protein G2W53_013046 [Senna tora]|uniref:Uncharacterized protein n=1 Tax=Senna tora TaxID=362788 RepID=A0A834TXS4_9FABA|nr:uncharacterized protein G2W53_013046 [Senna tora]
MEPKRWRESVKCIALAWWRKRLMNRGNQKEGKNVDAVEFLQ